MPRKSAVPTYRRKAYRGLVRACVTLTDRVTRERRDVLLGEFGSPESHQAYARVLAEWEANDRRLSTSTKPKRVAAAGVTVAELILAYSRHRKGEVDAGDYRSLKIALRLLNQLYGDTPAATFGPNALRFVREAMIKGDAAADPPRKAWSRMYCSRQTRVIVGMFRWASGRELLPPAVHQALRDLEPLRRGRTDAREAPPVACAPQGAIDAVLAIANKQIAATIRLQLATGMRSGEICSMRPCDLDRTGRVWTYTPATHKTAHLRKRRVIPLGPRAQRIIRPFLRGRMPAAALFSPAEAEAKRREEAHAARATPTHQGNRPGTNRVENPRKQPGDAYTTESYCRAVTKLCDRADELARARAKKAGLKVADGIRMVQRWHPHQLRHNYATEIRRQHGLEAAQLLLGHSSALVTDAVYADRDQAAMLRIAAKIG